MPQVAHEDALRRRIEAGIAVAAPLLDLALAVIDRISRVLGSSEPEGIVEGVRKDGGPARRGLTGSARQAGSDQWRACEP